MGTFLKVRRWDRGAASDLSWLTGAPPELSAPSSAQLAQHVRPVTRHRPRPDGDLVWTPRDPDYFEAAFWSGVAQLAGDRTPRRPQDWLRAQTWDTPASALDAIFWPGIAQLSGERTPRQRQEWFRLHEWLQTVVAQDALVTPFDAATWPGIESLLRAFRTPLRRQEWFRTQEWNQWVSPIPSAIFDAIFWPPIHDLAQGYRAPKRRQDWQRVQTWEQMWSLKDVLGLTEETFLEQYWPSLEQLARSFRGEPRTRRQDLLRPDFYPPDWWINGFPTPGTQPTADRVRGTRWPDIRGTEWPQVRGLRWSDVTEP